MDDQGSNASEGGEQRNEPVRSRWTPKPEQILILESIFNSGMVNPPKDETIRIRKLLEKFGSVGDANVFYWFQNRRSRSRRRQRQIQASLSGAEQATVQYGSSMGGDHNYSNYQAYSMMNAASCYAGSGSSSSSSAYGGSNSDGIYAFSGNLGAPGIDQGSVYSASDGSSLHYCQPGK